MRSRDIGATGRNQGIVKNGPSVVNKSSNRLHLAHVGPEQNYLTRMLERSSDAALEREDGDRRVRLSQPGPPDSSMG